MIDLKKTAVIGIDIQMGFGKDAQSDKLRSLRDSQDTEIDNAAALGEAAYEAGGAFLLSTDQHNKVGTKLPDGQIDNRSAAEFGIFDEHCVSGTDDAKFNPPMQRAIERLEAKGGPRTIVPVDEYDTSGRVGSPRLIEVHKNVNDVTKTMKLDGTIVPHKGTIAAIRALQAAGITNVVFTGKIIEVCVIQALESMLELFPELTFYVVEDAVCALPEGVAEQVGLQSKEAILARLQKKGVKVVKTADLVPSPKFIADGVLGL